MQTNGPRLQRQIIATTHIDSHQERLSRSALEGLLEQLQVAYIPIGYEHDPRFPPLGRVVGGRILQLDDGEFAIEAVQEFWDGDPTELTIVSDAREIPRLVSGQEAGVSYDRTFRDPQSRATLDQIGELLGSKPVEMSKKAVDPVSLLTLALGTFVLGGIAQGFFGKMGEDAYGALKQRLTELYQRRRSRGLIQIVAATTGPDVLYLEWTVIADRPPNSDMANLIDEVLTALDREGPKILLQLSDPRPARRVILTWTKHRLEPLHILDAHGVPLVIYRIPRLPSRMGRLLRRRGRDPGEPAHYSEDEDKSSTWRAFDVVRIEHASAANLPTLADGRAESSEGEDDRR